jgi:hypothetical protein
MALQAPLVSLDPLVPKATLVLLAAIPEPPALLERMVTREILAPQAKQEALE